ncbi:MAG: RHS repeat-associated core domain-containing protein [Gammaproteobacteria bacterium]|nr:RHS repeat-associated core domain-containing protein [Gammaproteobacteria bacterium]
MQKLERPGGVTEYRHLIPAGSGTVIYMRKPDASNATTYLTSDHLGSGDLILDSAGAVLARMSFTAFGARRGSNWSGSPSGADYTTFGNKTRRGFTGHEMLDALGLVNMNGRVYDPLIGRFLSADPIIQTLSLSQALNPYSYVMNRPLTCVIHAMSVHGFTACRSRISGHAGHRFQAMSVHRFMACRSSS